MVVNMAYVPKPESRKKVLKMTPPWNGYAVAEILVGGGAAAPPPPPPPPPHLHGKLTNFRKFWPKRGLKTVFSSANGGVCLKFESFVGNLGGFAPPPEEVNFRHCGYADIALTSEKQNGQPFWSAYSV
jgi:hypothetical protein